MPEGLAEELAKGLAEGLAKGLAVLRAHQKSGRTGIDRCPILRLIAAWEIHTKT